MTPCAGMTDLFFNPDTYRQARKVCSVCELRLECLDRHIDEPDGVFGGLSPEQRRHLRGRPHGGSRKRAIVHGTAAGRSAHLRRGEPPCEACREAANSARQRLREASHGS